MVSSDTLIKSIGNEESKMKRRKLILKLAILFAVMLTVSGCKIVVRERDLRSTLVATLGINTPRPPEEIALLSYHDRYVYATDEDNWAIRQAYEVSGLKGCELFILEHRGNGKFTLRTCYDRYIIAPDSGDNRKDWMLRQESEPDECGQFEMYKFEGKGVAFKTCAGRFFTAGDSGLGWEGELGWAIVGETNILDKWEYFTIEKK